MKEMKTVHFVDKSKVRIQVARSFEKMGIYGKPIGAENVQARIIAGGVKPEENIFSRALLGMREE